MKRRRWGLRWVFAGLVLSGTSKPVFSQEQLAMPPNTSTSHGRPAATKPPTWNPGGSARGRELIRARADYEAQKKNPWAALAFEALLPGLGNHYAGELDDALLTWTGLLIGSAFWLKGTGTLCDWVADRQDCRPNDVEVIMGWTFLVGSRLFGLSGAPLNVVRNNRALRTRLGIPEDVRFGVVPMMTAQTLGAGVWLSY